MAPATTTLPVQARPVQRALARSALYRLLSLACAYPSSDRIRVLRDEVLPTAQVGAAMMTGELADHLDHLASLLSPLDLETVQAHYHRALGHVSVSDCPAYESAYVGSNLFQQVQVMADVSGFYRAFGFAVSDVYRERSDHVAVELEFMHVLTYKEAFARVHHSRDKVAICRRGQRRFWGDHLGRWLPAFAQLLRAKAETGFYSQLALLLAAFAETEARTLGKAPPWTPGGPREGLSAAGPEGPCADDGCPLAPS